MGGWIEFISKDDALQWAVKVGCGFLRKVPFSGLSESIHWERSANAFRENDALQWAVKVGFDSFGKSGALQGAC